MVLEKFWKGFGEDLGRFGEVSERFSRSRSLEKAQRGPKAQKRLGEAQKAQMRPRRDPQKARPRKGWEEAPKPSPERVLGVLRGLGEVLRRFLKVLGRL